MLKSLLLSSVRPFYALDDEKGTEKSEADKQRDSIKVTNSDDKDKDDKTDDKVDKVDKEDDKEGDKEGEDNDKEGDEGGEDDKEDKEEEKELTAEQKEIEKLKKTVERLQKRVGKTTGEKSALATELQKAQTQLNAKVEAGEGLTEEEVERRAEIKANEKTLQKEFERAQAKLAKDAAKIDKDFKTKINDVAEESGSIPGAMIGILEDLDNGGAVLAYLANNPEDYEEVIGLNLAKMSNRLVKISDKLIEEAKPAIKKISKVPDPPEKNLKGNQSSPNILHDKMSDREWIEARNRQVAERHKAKMQRMS